MTGSDDANGNGEQVARYWGTVIIEWPAPARGTPYGAMPGRHVKVWDAATGEQVYGCTHADITVHAGVEGLVTADLTLFADEDGEPVLDLQPAVTAADRRIVLDEDGGTVTGVFPFLVTEMRVRGA